MKQVTQFFSGLIAIVSGLFGVFKLVPVIWAWIVQTGIKVAENMKEAANAFIEFQNAEPVGVGLMALAIGAVFASLAIVLRDKPEGTRKPKSKGFPFGRVDHEAVQWEKDNLRGT